MIVGQSKPTFQIATVPAPIGGLNAFDSLAAMPPTDAVVMNNFFPQPYGCLLRKGYLEHCTGFTAPVESLSPWNGDAGQFKLFAWAGSSMYDATARGPVGAPVVTGLSNDYWQAVNFPNIAGVHLVAVNGADDPIVYEGTAFNRLTLGDGVVPYTIKGEDPKKFVAVTMHQRRLWFVEKDSTKGWYLPTEQLYGEVKSFDFGPLFRRGGYLQLLATWTADDGGGARDHLAAISSRGDVAVYEGIDVSDPTAWKLTGVYFAGAPPLGRRFVTKVAGDLYLLTQIGVVSLTTMVQSTQVNVSTDNAESRKVQFLLSELLSNFGTNGGWELQFYPPINMLMINYKDYSLTAGQVIENQITKAWATFQGIQSNCWTQFNEVPFFGGDTAVYQAWTGAADGVKLDGSGGMTITGQVQQAYSYLGAPAAQKQVGMYRPNFMVDVPVNFASEIQYDFAFDELTDPTPRADRRTAVWNQAIWGTSYWSGGTRTQRDWIQAIGLGVAASLRLAVAAKTSVLWVSTDYTYKSGGPL